MRSVDYDAKAWNETRATQILHFIMEGNVAYASGIASKLDINSQTATNYIKGLKERDYIYEKERIQGKIIYEADLEDLAEAYYDYLIDQLETRKAFLKEEDLEEHVDTIEEILEDFQSMETRINSISLFEYYIETLFKNREAGTIKMSLEDLLIHEFSFSLIRYYYNTETEETEEWFDTLVVGLINSGVSGWSINSLDEVMRKWEEEDA
jgi:Mn-dependent DtxR family transcriptional regulator